MADDNLQQCAQCSERAWRLAYALMRNAHDAEDVVQESFVVAARRRDRIPSDDPWPWFATVVTNVARNARRTRRKHMHDEPRDTPAHAPDADLSVLVAEALAQLPEPERDALACTHLSGLTQAQAAEALEVPTGTVATRVRSGLAKLREKLGKDEKNVAYGIGIMFIPQPTEGFQVATQRWVATAQSRAEPSTTGANMNKQFIVAGAVLIAIGLVVWLTQSGNTSEVLEGENVQASTARPGDGETVQGGNTLPANDNGKDSEPGKQTPKPEEHSGKSDKPGNQTPSALVLSKTLRFAESIWPRTLDPHASSDTSSARQCAMVYESLLETDPFTPTVLRPCIADALPEWDSQAQTWTFRLRNDVRFHDDPCFVTSDNLNGTGRAVTAGDVVWSIKRMALQDNYWLLQGQVQGLDDFRRAGRELGSEELSNHLHAQVSGLSAPDDRTVVIKIARDDPTFLFALSNVATSIVPPEAIALYGDEFAFHPVGTGPYVVETQVWNQRIDYVANPNYREVRLSGVPDDSRVKALEGRRLPLTHRVAYEFGFTHDELFEGVRDGRFAESPLTTEAMVELLGENAELTPGVHALDGGLAVVVNVEPTLNYWQFNMDSDLIGKGDRARAMRTALALAFDRAAYTRTMAGGRGLPANGLIPQSVTEHDSSIDNQRFDATKAREVLTQAGFKLTQHEGTWTAIDPDTARQPELTLVTRSLEVKVELRDLVRLLSDTTGIAIRIETSTFPDFLKRQDERDGHIFDAGWVMDFPAPENIYGLWKTGELSLGFSNKEYDEAVDRIRGLRSGDIEARKDAARAWKSMHDVLGHETPFIAISFRLSVTLFREGYMRPDAPVGFGTSQKYSALAE